MRIPPAGGEGIEVGDFCWVDRGCMWCGDWEGAGWCGQRWGGLVGLLE